MNRYGGLFFCFFEPKHRETLLGRIDRNSYFTSGVSNKDIHPERAEVCLLSFDKDSITHICLARRGKSSETGRMTLKFERFLDLGPITSETFKASPALFALVSQLLARPVSRVGGEDWNALIDAVKSVRPALTERIDALDKVRRSIGVQSDEDAFAIVAEEKDATRLALEIFGLEKERIRSTIEVEPTREPAPFLKGLRQARLMEDSMIFHDSALFPGLKKIASYVQGAIEFEERNERITVLNVNREKIERSIGVDLIYYNHIYRAYLLVQYKRMRKVPSDWEFNLNEKQFLHDIKRMEGFESVYPETKLSGNPNEYRLNPEIFYFKFCEEITYEPMSTDLIQGMYLPLAYLKCLMNSPVTYGELGGRILRYKNSHRHFNNSQFISLVRDAWIGSRTDTTDVITSLIQDSIAGKRSVIFGIESRD